MSDPAKPEDPKHLGEPGEHPLSVLLFSWMRSKQFLRLFLIGLAVLCAVLAALDFVFHRHPKNPVEGLPGFFGVYGFLAFGLAVLSGWPLGKLLRRPEDYYTRDEKEPGDDR
jgi:hypothetical protein